MQKFQAFKARHSVLSILFITWIVSSVDRMAMSVAIPYIAEDFQLDPFQSGILLSAFFAGYSISQIPGGILADLFGVRRLATIAMVWWSVFTAVTGAAVTFIQMLVARFVFGLGEGLYPACAFKTVAVWFPQKERATANAIMLASNPLGVAISPLVVVAIMAHWDWRVVFYCLFLPGIITALLFWIFVPNRPSESRYVSAEELSEIEADSAQEGAASKKVTIRQIVKEPHILKYFLVLFSFDIAFWGFTAWLPTYLVNERGFSMLEMGVAASLPFFAGTVGSVVGGWVSDRFFSTDRRMPIIVAELLSALMLYLTFTAQSATMMVIYQTLAGFFLASFFSTFWAMPMNTVPKKLMGVASGFINMAGQIAAFVSPLLLGGLVQAAGGSFDTTFALLVVSLLVSSAIVLTIPRNVGRTEEALAFSPGG